MDPASGKLFGVIGNVEPNDETPAFPMAGTDPDFSRWYTQQWLKCHGFGVEASAEEADQPAAS